MKWITQIIEVHPYKVKCLWNDGMIRVIDLEAFLMVHSKEPTSSYYQLLNKKKFSKVRCDGTTLFWDNGITMKDLDDVVKPAALDIDPDVLFEMTIETLPVHKRRKREAV